MGRDERMIRDGLLLGLLALAAVSPCWESGAQAGFHDGGVAGCANCHIMHDQDVGGPGGPGGNRGPALLVDGPASDLCLNCHANNYGAVMSSDPLNPAPERGPGNFGFLLANNINDGSDGIANPISGDHAGHNINAPGFGLSPDGTYQTSPGGTFPTMKLGCTSCHDPHGNENYRLLRGPGMAGIGVFSSPAPIAVGLSLEFPEVETDGTHVAYVSGMSQWCANCHRDYLLLDHKSTVGSFEHPSDEGLGSDIGLWYSNYNGTADPTGGDALTAYLAAVPFEDSANTVLRTAGPTAGSQVMCLSCHRAHASSGPYSGRWDFNVTTLGQDGVVSGSYPLPNPYPDPSQQPLCFKCHETGED